MCEFDSKQVEKNNIAGFFPLHNLKRKQELSDAIFTLKTFPWDFPLFRMKVWSHHCSESCASTSLLMHAVLSC